MAYRIIQNKNLFLEICPEMGASVINFKEKKNNLDIFRPLKSKKKISKYNSYFTGYFATIPYFGSVKKNSFYHHKKNKYISLPKTHILEVDTIHGEGWISKWQLNSQTNNSITLIYTHNGKKNFPCLYRAIQKFELIKNSLIISITLKNLGEYPFDCGIGFHPWFNINDKSRIYSNTLTYLKEKKVNNFKKIKFLNKKFLDLNKYKIDSTFLNWNGKSKLVINKDVSILIKNKKNIRNLHVYSPPKEDFFCIEPVTNIADAFNIKKVGKDYHGLVSLLPKKEFKAIVEFQVLN